MARPKKIKFVTHPLFTPKGVFDIQLPENFPKEYHHAVIDPGVALVVSKQEYAELLHLKASRLHENARNILQSISQPVESNNDTAMAVPGKRKYTRRAKTKLVAKVRKVSAKRPRKGSFNASRDAAKLAELAAKARARRAAKKAAK